MVGLILHFMQEFEVEPKKPRSPFSGKLSFMVSIYITVCFSYSEVCIHTRLLLIVAKAKSFAPM